MYVLIYVLIYISNYFIQREVSYQFLFNNDTFLVS